MTTLFTAWFKGLSKLWCVYAKKRPYSEIDSRIKPLVDSMNATGLIKTVASCQGHGILWKPPYVYFKSSVSLAASIEQLLREASIVDDPRLKKAWAIKGIFDDEHELTFFLYSPEFDEKSESLFSAVWLSRKAIDRDLRSLADIIKQAVLLNIRHERKPKITTRGDDDGNA